MFCKLAGARTISSCFIHPGNCSGFQSLQQHGVTGLGQGLQGAGCAWEVREDVFSKVCPAQDDIHYVWWRNQIRNPHCPPLQPKFRKDARLHGNGKRIITDALLRERNRTQEKHDKIPLLVSFPPPSVLCSILNSAVHLWCNQSSCKESCSMVQTIQSCAWMITSLQRRCRTSP